MIDRALAAIACVLCACTPSGASSATVEGQRLHAVVAPDFAKFEQAVLSALNSKPALSDSEIIDEARKTLVELESDAVFIHSISLGRGRPGIVRDGLRSGLPADGMIEIEYCGNRCGFTARDLGATINISDETVQTTGPKFETRKVLHGFRDGADYILTIGWEPQPSGGRIKRP